MQFSNVPELGLHLESPQKRILTKKPVSSPSITSQSKREPPSPAAVACEAIGSLPSPSRIKPYSISLAKINILVSQYSNHPHAYSKHHLIQMFPAKKRRNESLDNISNLLVFHYVSCSRQVRLTYTHTIINKPNIKSEHDFDKQAILSFQDQRRKTSAKMEVILSTRMMLDAEQAGIIRFSKIPKTLTAEMFWYDHVHVQERKTQKVYHCEHGWHFDSSHCNEGSRDPQAKLAKPNWMTRHVIHSFATQSKHNSVMG
ncbi:hypothetical protein DV515_00001823 [Chloebia gouldiae]|uniref:Uncharacterized protein n=1 Tax=Chloebia gouldiae TaxID=44316 RepID=A0A3L8SYJ0_CHLGU|nr:hypothetical protein DV515_00001823 [Chloebia gouldiae]